MGTTALFFGSFNPVHIGHLIIAQSLLDCDGVDEVWIVPSPHNPLKGHDSLMDDSLRLEMVRAAVADNPRIGVCDIEFHLPTPSYTALTLDALGLRHPDRRFALAIGTDNLELFDRWREHERILGTWPLLVYPRPGHDGGPLAHHPAVRMLDMPLIGISSTQIRQRLARGQEVRYLVPEAARQLLVNPTRPNQ